MCDRVCLRSQHRPAPVPPAQPTFPTQQGPLTPSGCLSPQAAWLMPNAVGCPVPSVGTAGLLAEREEGLSPGVVPVLAWAGPGLGARALNGGRLSRQN